MQAKRHRHSPILGLLAGVLLPTLALGGDLTSKVPIGVPQLVAHVEDQTLPVTLEALDVRVRIHGFLTETTLTMIYFNDDPRDLEGEFLIRLPEGASVSGYGLDVEGVLVDGVVVEKQKARIAFEREARNQIDPGLVEWAGGNLFRTRIYPIAGQSRRIVRVQYISQLDFKKPPRDSVDQQTPPQRFNAVYRYAMSFLPTLKKLNLALEVTQPDQTPTVVSHPFESLQRNTSTESFTLSGSGTQLQAKQDFELTLHENQGWEALTQEIEPGKFSFTLSDFRRVPPRSAPTQPPPQRIALFWDASFSRRNHDHAKEVEMLSTLLATWKPREVVLTLFRDQASPPRRFTPKRGGYPHLLRALGDITYDGATSWQQLTRSGSSQFDNFLLFTEGRVNFGARQPPRFDSPALIFNTSESGDPAILKHLAERSEGFYFDLTTSNAQEVLDRLESNPRTFTGTTVTQGTVGKIEAPIGRRVDGPIVVCGQVTSPTAEIRLHFEEKGLPPDSKVFPIEAKPGSDLVSRYCALKRINQLALYPKENQQVLLKLGRAYGLVTPSTSLMVLETLDQYLEYQIEPPDSLPEIRKHYFERLEAIEDDSSELLEDYSNSLVEQWEDYLDWSRQEFSFPEPGSLAPLSIDQEVPEQNSPSGPVPEPVQEPTISAPSPPRLDPFAGRSQPNQTVRGVALIDQDFLPGVEIRFESNALVEPLTLITDAHGTFQTPTLSPGHYRLISTLDGFKPFEREIWIERATPVQIDIELMVSSIEEAIVVSADPIGDPDSGGTQVTLTPWIPERPYLDVLIRTPKRRLYRTYIQQRTLYESSPSFYVDCAHYFLDQGLTELGLRIASTLLELEVEEPRLIHAAATLFLKAEAWDFALILFEDLATLRPELPQSRRDLALARIYRGLSLELIEPNLALADYQVAADLLQDVAVRPWGTVISPFQLAYLDDGRFEEIGRIALVESNWARRKLEAVSQRLGVPLVEAEADWFDRPDADLRITLAWSDEFADMDLWVIEPSGEKVYYRNPASEIGGLLSEDCTFGLGPETYLIKNAMPGTYRILVNYYSDGGPELLGPVSVQTQIIKGFGRENEVIYRHEQRLESTKDTVEIGQVTVD